MQSAPGSKSPRNLAARAGRWSAQHRRIAIFGWIAFVVAALLAGGALGTRTIEASDSGVGESGRADQVLQDAFPERAEETVLVQSRTMRATDPRFRAAVDDVVRRISAHPAVGPVRSPYSRRNPGQISGDGRSALVGFELRGDLKQAEARIDSVLATTSAAQRAHPELRIEQSGGASMDKALSESFAEDFRRAETLSIPITLVILVVAFGALVAAGLPLLLALSAVGATIGLIGVLSQVVPVDQSIGSVVLLIGLAVGVDYSLFYLRREREERAAGRGERAALEAAAATSGRAVLISGFTVMIAMAGMFFAGAATFSSMAAGTILVVAIALIASLTVLPAVLSKLGDRVEKGRIPLVHRLRRPAGESRLWGALLDRVLRRPLASAIVSGGLLVALAVPTLGMQTALPGIDTIPRDRAVMRTYDRIQAAFPGKQLPATVVVRAADVTEPAVARGIEALARAARRSDRIAGPAQVEVSKDRRVAAVSLPVAGDGTDGRSDAALEEIRTQLVPDTVGAVAGVRAGVTGVTAGTKDFNDLMRSNVWLVFAFVLSMAFALLMVTFRSIVIPLKAIVLNLLSVGAAYGLLVLVFQHGVGASLIGADSTGPITSWLPLFLFVVLFGLSMDYHVFILTRVREAFDRGMSTEDAVAHGIRTTAGVVTSAALVMVAVFAVFATLSAIEFKQLGVGLAAAVLIDATIVRGVLLPATMKLLGDWNWYLPKQLRWLPRIAHDGAVPAAGRA